MRGGTWHDERAMGGHHEEGMVWHGVAWCDMVCNGVQWCAMVCHGVAWCEGAIMRVTT